MRPQSRKSSKGRQTGRKGKGGRRPRGEPLLEQPLAELNGNVPCPICGHPVDAKRMHPHMVRFHGVAIRAKSGWQAEQAP